METPKRYLFVCGANVNRSKMGVYCFKKMLEEKNYSVGSLEETVGKDFYIGSAGMDIFFSDLKDGTQYTAELGESVNLIFAAGDSIYRDLVEYLNTPPEKVVNLRIPDHYDITKQKERKNLRRIMRKKLEDYVPEAKK
jgi:protein-tyrosine-phosphatase